MKYDYRIVLSFAEEQKSIAAGIHDCLELMGISSYFYPRYDHMTWGKNLGAQLPQVYQYQGELGLIILSKEYLNKKYTLIEAEALVNRASTMGQDFLFVLKTDATSPLKIQGISSEKVYLEWDYNPGRIAELLSGQLSSFTVPSSDQPEIAPEKNAGNSQSSSGSGKSIQIQGDLNSDGSISIS